MGPPLTRSFQFTRGEHARGLARLPRFLKFRLDTNLRHRQTGLLAVSKRSHPPACLLPGPGWQWPLACRPGLAGRPCKLSTIGILSALACRPPTRVSLRGLRVEASSCVSGSGSSDAESQTTSWWQRSSLPGGPRLQLELSLEVSYSMSDLTGSSLWRVKAGRGPGLQFFKFQIRNLVRPIASRPALSIEQTSLVLRSRLLLDANIQYHPVGSLRLTVVVPTRDSGSLSLT